MNISEIVKNSISYSEVARKLGHKYINGTITRKVKKIVKENNCDTSHFRKGLKCKFPKVSKICPNCKKEFKTKIGSKEERQTCSYSCSNKYFRSGPENGNWKDSAYRTTCFHSHPKKCSVCPEENIVEVHHLDENKENNDPSNLIPLCPTHHQYWHSRFKYLIEEKVLDYIKNWKKLSVA